MIAYFGYGSNLDLTSLRAKGVDPVCSESARLCGWQLRFNVRHWFRHEGGVGNIVFTGNPLEFVEGVLHIFPAEELPTLDAMEAYGSGYDRIVVAVETSRGIANALAYCGLPEFIDDNCLPTQRYLNILVRGAEAADLSAAYIVGLRTHPVHVLDDYPPFEYPPDNGTSYTHKTLASHQQLTALAGCVFDMRNAHPRLASLNSLFGGKDMTLFHVKRHDTSTGRETLDDVIAGNLPAQIKKYINAYLHEYSKEFIYAGRYRF